MMSLGDKRKEFKENLAYALGKFNWGNSPLDAKAIEILNTWRKVLDEQDKQFEDKIAEIIESLPVYRNVFIRKSSLIKQLEEAFPEK